MKELQQNNDMAGQDKTPPMMMMVMTESLHLANALGRTCCGVVANNEAIPRDGLICRRAGGSV